MAQHHSPRLNRAARHFRNGVAHAVEIGRDEAGEILSTMQELGTDAGRAARDGLRQTQSQVNGYLEGGWDSIVRTEKRLLNKALTNPGKTLLIAAGAALLFTYVYQTRASGE